MERLATLGTAFSQNVLADEQAFALRARRRGGPRRPAGLHARAAARAKREERGLPASTSITLSRSSVEPFLQFSARRDLREKAFRAWIARGDNGGATDNKAIIAEMVALRAERARLLGYADFAHYRLDDAMAKTPAAVRDLLADGLGAGARSARSPTATPCRSSSRRRAAISRSRHGTGATTPRSCASARCDFDEAEIKPYLQLDRMIEAAFYTAQRLFGLTFEERTDVPTWHPDVRVWEVRGARRRAPRPVLRRLFRAALEAQRRLDDHAARPGEARRRHPRRWSSTS